MRTCTRGMYLFTGLAAIFVAVSSVVAAVRQQSWDPVIMGSFVPAVIIATRPGASRRCLPRRTGSGRSG